MYAVMIHTSHVHVFSFVDLVFENFPKETQSYECMHAYGLWCGVVWCGVVWCGMATNACMPMQGN